MTTRHVAQRGGSSDAGELPQTYARVRVNQQGRIVIPAEFRKALGIGAGDVLAVAVVGDHLEVVTQDALWERFRSMFSHVPAEPSLVDELLADRRAEVQRDAQTDAIPRSSGSEEQN